MAYVTTIEDWLTEVINDHPDDKRCVAITLLHQRPNESSPTEEYTHRFSTGIPIPQIARILDGKAESFAQGLPGHQQFWLYAFYAKDGVADREPGARHPFSKHGQTDYGPLGTDAPDARGRGMQEMRMKEGFFQMACVAINDARKALLQAAEISSGMVRNLHEANLRLMEENEKAKDFVFRTMVEQREKEASDSMRILEYERATEERRKFFELLPALANTFLGNVFPKDTQDTAIIKGIFAELPPETVRMLAGQLPNQIGAIVLTRFEELAKEKEEKARSRITTLKQAEGLQMRPELGQGEIK
jgi:hypothetical protein